MKRWRIPLMVMSAVMMMLLAGCSGGGVKQVSWPGMILSGDIIYAANVESVQAIDAQTGGVYWSFPPQVEKNVGPFYATPVLASDVGPHGTLLVAGMKDQKVYALQLAADPHDLPEVQWVFAEAAGQYVGSGVVAGDLFIIGNGDGNVYALNINDGQLVWSFTTGDRVWATPVVNGETVYVASLDHHIYALSLADGEEQWNVELGGAIASTPVLVGDSLWVGDFANTFYQVDATTGEIEWQQTFDDWLWATPSVQGTTIYFADVGGKVYALDTTTHTFIWDQPADVGAMIRARMAFNPDGSRLFVAGYETGKIYVVDTQTGAQLTWGTVIDDPGELPADLVTDGTTLYVMPVISKTRIRALDMNTGKVLWAYPPATSK